MRTCPCLGSMARELVGMSDVTVDRAMLGAIGFMTIPLASIILYYERCHEDTGSG